MKFSPDILVPPDGTPLPAGGGEPGKALMAFLDAVAEKNWTKIKAGLSPKQLSGFDKSYNTAAENAASAVDILTAWFPMTNRKVAAGTLLNPAMAVLELVGKRFGSRILSLVRVVKTGAAWQFDEAVSVGLLR